jgi:uncharacterized protein
VTTVLVAVALGLAIGLVLGALGGGGSVLTVPALVFLLGMSATAATTASLVIVGVTSVVAAVGHARHGRVRWRQGLLLAAVGVPASVGASRLNRLVDEDVLLLAFAVVMVVAAVGMLVQAGDAAAPPPPDSGGPWLATLLVGLTVGGLTGFLGVGGGFVVVPALVLVLRVPLATAVGTSLVVIAVNAAVALLARIGAPAPEWDVVLPFTAAAVAAALAGGRVAGRVRGESLSRAFAVLLLGLAAYVGAQALRGLA